MKKMLKRTVVAAMAGVMLLSGCGGTKSDGENVTISIGNWPSETNDINYKAHQDWLAAMNQEHPEITIIQDNYQYGTDTFFTKGASGQLPTMYLTWFTEVNKIIDAGFCTDITAQMKKYGYDEALNPLIKETLQKDGKYYAVPTSVYAQGIAVNKKLFAEAGLLNEDGTVKAPQTYEELAETAKIIKEKTGKAGFALGTSSKQGGWHFMNIAWSHGVEFMKKNDDGSWTATFNTPECVEALQYVKDLKWKYDVLPSNNIINLSEIKKQVATGQAAMCFLDPPANELITSYGMNKDDIAFIRVPAGPKGRFAQMGGNLYMLSNQATEEEKDAVFQWLETIGVTPKVGERQIESWKSTARSHTEKGGVEMGEEAIKIWNNAERLAKQKESMAEFVNINPSDFADYLSFEGVTVRPEEPMECQQLYAIIDAAIQKVLTDKNADVAAIVEKANNDFQTNFLDKID